MHLRVLDGTIFNSMGQPKFILLYRSLANTLSELPLFRTGIRPVWFSHNRAIPASSISRSLC